MSGRATSDLALHDPRARINAAQVLIIGLSTMRDQSEMYDRRESAYCALGARECTGRDAKAPGPYTAGISHTPSDRRTSLRHAQSMDGSDAFSDQNIAARECRDESACLSIQHETSDADHRNRTTHGGDEGLSALLFA